MPAPAYGLLEVPVELHHGLRCPVSVTISGVELYEEPLTDETLDEVVAFFRSANPFAERASGWDTGRFVDFRWGSHAVRAADDPDLFGRLCRIFRDGNGIRATTVNEDDNDREFIITPTVDVAAARHVLPRLVEIHQGRGADLVCEISDAEEWLAEVFAGAGMTEEKQTGHEWEYDLASLPEAVVIADGFAIETLVGISDRAVVYRGISDCIGKAFGGEADSTPVLRSLEGNPMFRPELTVFARSSDGTVAAYCRGTVDPGNGVCGIDPVCTHPDFQRLGLGRAVVQRCFANQRALGGRFSYIGSAPEPKPGTYLYRSLGPSSRTTFSTWTLHTPVSL